METVDLDSLIGKSLDNRFVLKKLIGKGGYGAVFEAVQTSMQRRCAIKVLSIQTDDPKQVARFELEARVTCQLTHPNTIVVYEYGRDEELGVFFIAMEFLDGQSLGELANSRCLSVEESFYILGQIADSLDDAHTYDLVHRDIKPHNIMIVKRGIDDLWVKVIDFGIAKTQDQGLDLTRTDTIIGTPKYMSTEQVLNKELTGKSDQYALAVTAYYLLTGRTVFNYDTAIQIAVAHASEIPPAISTVTDRFIGTEAFDSTLLKALSKEPTDRFESCRQFVDALLKTRPGTNPDSSEYPPVSFGSKKESDLSTNSFEHAVAKTEVAGIESNLETPSALLAVAKSVQSDPFKKGVVSDHFSVAQPPKNNTKTFFVLGLLTIVALLGTFLLFGNKSENSKLADNTNVDQVAPEKKAEIIPVGKSPDKVVPIPEKPTTIDEPIEEKTSVTIEKKPKVKEPKIKEKNKVSTSVSDTLSALKNKTPKTQEIPKKKNLLEKTRKKEATGVVKIYTTPWGDIYVDGKKRSSKARYNVTLSEGVHTFSLRQKGVIKATKRLKVITGKTQRVRLAAD